MQMKVSICIITYKRKQGILKLLKSIANLEMKSYPSIIIEVIVIENEKDGYLEEVKQEIENNFPWELKWGIEHCKGIPFARNKSVRLSSERSDFIVFVDDDEEVAPDWLDKLLATQQKYNADVVQGPVLPYYDSSVLSIYKNYNVFNRPRYQTGTLKKSAATSNVLVKKEIINSFDKPFSEELVGYGGSDSNLFSQIAQRGYSIIWCNEAVVHEKVGADRANLRWFTRRCFRGGSIWVFCCLQNHRDISTYLNLVFRGFRRIVFGCLVMVSSIFYPPFFFKGYKYIISGIGMLSGLFKIHIKEYK